MRTPTTSSLIERLVEHLVWADGQVARALAAAPDEKGLELYTHVVGAEHGWLGRIDGPPAGAAMWWSSIPLDEVVQRSGAGHARLAALARGDAESLQHAITYRTSDGREFTSTVEDILVHVALHGQHHRAQIATLLRQAGARPPSLDYIAWARGGAAATRS